MGTITSFSGKKHSEQCFYFFTSFTNPGMIFQVDFDSGDYTPKLFRQISLPDFDPTKFETTQVFYPSKDGTKIPMFLVSKAVSILF